MGNHNGSGSGGSGCGVGGGAGRMRLRRVVVRKVSPRQNPPAVVLEVVPTLPTNYGS